VQPDEEQAGAPGERLRSASDGELSLTQAELVERVGWLIRLRWPASSGVVATILISRVLFDGSLPWARLLAAALSIPIYNLVFLLAWRRIRSAKSGRIERASSWLANGQIFCDLLVLSVLIHLSGGVENQFGFYFVFHMVIASILLSRTAAFVQAGAATVMFAAVAVGEYWGILEHYESPALLGEAHLAGNPTFVFAAVWVLATSLGVTVYLATSIATNLRWREQQVVDLSRRVSADAEELRLAYERLAETERAKSAYARKVAHEMRSPLAAIDSLLRAVADGLTGEVPGAAREMISRARIRAQGLLAVARDLLALAAARDVSPLSTESTVDLRAALEEVISMLVPQAEARKTALRSEIGPDVPPIRGNKDAIHELLGNLLSNAIKYSPDGAAVEIKICKEEDSVVIRVSDQGIGIAESDKERIFEEFYRAENAREFTSDGTGLGLSIVKSIVEAHGGMISVENRPEGGTTFTVRLPAGIGEAHG